MPALRQKHKTERLKLFEVSKEMVQSVIESFEWGLESPTAIVLPNKDTEVLSEDETEPCSTEFQDDEDDAAILQTVVALGLVDPAIVQPSRFSQRSRRISRKISVQSNGGKSGRSSRRASGRLARLGRCVSGDKRVPGRGVARCKSLKCVSPCADQLRMPRRVLSSEGNECSTPIKGRAMREGSLTYSIPTSRLSLRRTSGHLLSRKQEMPACA